MLEVQKGSLVKGMRRLFLLWFEFSLFFLSFLLRLNLRFPLLSLGFGRRLRKINVNLALAFVAYRFGPRFTNSDKRRIYVRAEVQLTAKHLVAFECESALKAFTLEHLRKPESIVLPHLVVGNFVDLHPHWQGFVGLG